MANTKERRHLWRRPYLMGSADTNILAESVIRTERNCDAEGRFHLTRDYGVNPINLKMIVQLVTGPSDAVIGIHPAPDPDAVRPDLDIAWQFLVTIPIADPVNAGYFTIQTLIDKIRQGMLDGTYVFYAGEDPGGSYKKLRPFDVPAADTLNVSSYAVYPPLDIREHLGYVYLHNLADPSAIISHRTTRIYVIDIEEAGSDYNLSKEILFPIGLQDEDYLASASYPERRTWLSSISQSSELVDTPGSPRRSYTPKGSRLLMGNEDISQDGLNRSPLALAWNTDELNRRTIRRIPVPASLEVPWSRRTSATPADRNRVQLSGLSSSYASALNTSDWIYVDRPTAALEDIFRVTDELGNDVLVDGEPVRVVAVVAGPDEDLATFLSDPNLTWEDVLDALAELPDIRQRTWDQGETTTPETYFFGRVNQVKFEKIGPSTPDTSRAGYDQPGWPPRAGAVRYKTGIQLPETLLDMIEGEGETAVSTSPFLRNVREYDLVRIQNATLKNPVDHNSEGVDVDRPDYGGSFTPEEIAEALAAANFDYEVEGLHDDFTIMLRSRRPGMDGEMPSLLLNDGFGRTVTDPDAFGEIIVTAPGNFFYQPWVVLWPIPPQSYKKLFIRCMAAQYPWDSKEIFPLSEEKAPWRPYFQGYDDVFRLPDMQRMPWLVSTALAAIMGRHVEQSDEYGLYPFAYPETLLAQTEGDYPAGKLMPSVYNEWDEDGPAYTEITERAEKYRYDGDGHLNLEDLHRRVGVQGMLAGMGRMFDEPQYEYGAEFDDVMRAFLLSGSGGYFGYVSGRPLTLYQTLFSLDDDELSRYSDYQSYPATERSVDQTHPEGPFDASMDSIGIITAPDALFTPEDVGLIAVLHDEEEDVFSFVPMTIIKYIDKNRVMVVAPIVPLPFEGAITGSLYLYYADHYMSVNEGALLRLSRMTTTDYGTHPMMFDEVCPPAMPMPWVVRHLMQEGWLFRTATDLHVVDGLLLFTPDGFNADEYALLQTSVDTGNAPFGGTVVEISGTRYYDGIYAVAATDSGAGTVSLCRIGGLSVVDQGTESTAATSFYYMSISSGGQYPRVSYDDTLPATTSSRAVLAAVADENVISDLRFALYGAARGGSQSDPVHAVVGLANSWHHGLDFDGTNYIGTRGFGGFFDSAHGASGGVHGKYVGLYGPLHDPCTENLGDSLSNYNTGIGGEFVAASSGKYIQTKSHRSDGEVQNYVLVGALGAPVKFQRHSSAAWVSDRGVSLTQGDVVLVHDTGSENRIVPGIYHVEQVTGQYALILPYLHVDGTPNGPEVRSLALHDADGLVQSADLMGVEFTVLGRVGFNAMHKSGGVVGIAINNDYNINGLDSSIPPWPDPAGVFVTSPEPTWVVGGATRNLGNLLKWAPGITGGPTLTDVIPSTATILANNLVDTGKTPRSLLAHYFDSFASEQVGRVPLRTWSLYDMNSQSGAVTTAGQFGGYPLDDMSLRCAALDVIAGDLLMRSGYLITEPFSNTMQYWSGEQINTRLLQRRGVLGELSPVADRRFSLGRPGICSFEGISDSGDVLDTLLSVPHHANTKDGFARPKYTYGTGVVGDSEYYFGDWRPVSLAEMDQAPGVRESDGYAGYSEITFPLASVDSMRFINDGESFTHSLRGELAELRLITFARIFADENEAELWQPAHAYVIGDVIYPDVTLECVYVCYDAGNSSGTEPVWGADLVTDGGVKWRKWSTAGTTWQSGHSYALGDMLRKPTLKPTLPNYSTSYIVTDAGTSGGVEPDWSTLAASYVDGGVVWTKVSIIAMIYNDGEYRHRCIIKDLISYDSVGGNVTVSIFPPLPPVCDQFTPSSGNVWEPNALVPIVRETYFGLISDTYPELSVRVFRSKRRHSSLVKLLGGSSGWYSIQDISTDDSIKGLPGGWWMDPEYRRVYETWAQLTINDVGRIIRLYTDSNEPQLYDEVVITDVKVSDARVWAKLEGPSNPSATSYRFWKLMPSGWDDVVAGHVQVEHEVSAKAVFVDREDDGDGVLGAMGMWHPASDFQSAYTCQGFAKDGSVSYPGGVYLHAGSRRVVANQAFDWNIHNDISGSSTTDAVSIRFTSSEGYIVPKLATRAGTLRRVDTYQRYHKKWREARPYWEWARPCTNSLYTDLLTRHHTWVLPLQIPQGAVLERVRLWLGFGGFTRHTTADSTARVCGRVGAFLKVNEVPDPSTRVFDLFSQAELESSPGSSEPYPTRESGAVFSVRMHRDVSDEKCWVEFDELNASDFYEDGTITIVDTPPNAGCHRLISVARHNFYPSGGVLFQPITRTAWAAGSGSDDYIYGESDLLLDLPGCGIINDNARGRVELVVGLAADPLRYLDFAGDTGASIPQNENAEAVLRFMRIYGAEVHWTYPNSEQSPGTRMSIAENMTAGATADSDPREVSMAQPRRIQLRPYPS
jgi:hypothetical protein